MRRGRAAVEPGGHEGAAAEADPRCRRPTHHNPVTARGGTGDVARGSSSAALRPTPLLSRSHTSSPPTPPVERRSHPHGACRPRQRTYHARAPTLTRSATTASVPPPTPPQSGVLQPLPPLQAEAGCAGAGATGQSGGRLDHTPRANRRSTRSSSALPTLSVFGLSSARLVGRQGGHCESQTTSREAYEGSPHGGRGGRLVADEPWRACAHTLASRGWEVGVSRGA